MKRALSIVLAVWCGAVRLPGQTTNHITLEELRNLRLPDAALEFVAHTNADLRRNPNSKAFVDAQGVIGGDIRFELLLPDDWNGRFVMGGGGGFVGTVQNSARYSVNRGYATVGTDTGHEWKPAYTAGWAYDNAEARVNFGYLGVHRTAEVAKALIRAYYGADPAYSYFAGCSRGGGQAMMEAQRYPQDFNGIVAGAPAFDWTGLAATAITIEKALYPDPEHLDHTALDREALTNLQQAILEQCDAQDGLKDGVVQDPPSVRFDLSKVPGLTDAQRKDLETIYTGAGGIYPGFTSGAECDPQSWFEWIVGPAPWLAKDHAPSLGFAFGTQIFKYLIFNDPDWNYATYSFSNFANDARLAASYLNATNANLDGFKARNGKLIIWHGWADPAVPAEGSVNYYRRVLEHDPDAQAYTRLFMIPGCLHCGDGPGASEVDWLSVIVAWVERGEAPYRVIASRRERGRVEMTRPLFTYPNFAVYKGSGDPDSADSFVERPGAEAH